MKFDFANVTNFVIDIVIFVVVELITKYLSTANQRSRKTTHRPSRVRLLATQLFILLVCIALLAVHHIPYLLIIITGAIGIRIVAEQISGKESSGRNNFLSSPLKLAHKENTHVPGSLNSDHRNHVPQLNRRNINDTFSPPEKPFTYRNTSMSSLPSNVTSMPSKMTSVPSKVASVPLIVDKFPRPNQPSKVQTGLSSLQRSHIKSTSNPSPTANPVDYTRSLPPNKAPSTLGYFGSLFNFSTRPSGSPPGLVNSGNTCFINSILQCLTWTPGFYETLTSTICESEVLLCTLRSVLDQCHTLPNGISTYESVRTTDLLQVLSQRAPHLVTKSGVMTYQSQQDSAEFLLWLINHVHSGLSQCGDKKETKLSTDLALLRNTSLSELNGLKSNDSTFNDKLIRYSDIDWKIHKRQAESAIYDWFLGQLLEARECQLCQKVSLNIEYFTVLPLPLPTVIHTDELHSLEDCFSLFGQVEELVQSNMIICSCLLPNEETYTPGNRRALISKPPKSLVIQLTRYSYDASSQSASKNNVSVQFPIDLSLPCTVQSVLNAVETTSEILYTLTGVCVHSGAASTSHGHYVAYCRAGENWYYFNDEEVERIFNIREELNRQFVLQNAYLLFYTRA